MMESSSMERIAVQALPPDMMEHGEPLDMHHLPPPAHPLHAHEHALAAAHGLSHHALSASDALHAAASHALPPPQPPLPPPHGSLSSTHVGSAASMTAAAAAVAAAAAAAAVDLGGPPLPHHTPAAGARAQRHTRQEDWVTCLDCIDKPKPPLPERWRPLKDECIKCVKARSRAVSADKTQIDNYVNHAYSRTGQLMVLMTFDPLKKELKLQGAPILVERFLNHDVQGFLCNAIFEPAVEDTEQARHIRACSFKRALPLLPRKGLGRMTQDELRSFIAPLVCAYADREQPGWSDESKRIECWPDGVPWGNPKHGSWKLGNESPNAIFRRIIANIYTAAGREDLLKPIPPVCHGACEKCCGIARGTYEEEMMEPPGEEGAHVGAHGDVESMVQLAAHQLSEQAALAAVATMAAAASAAPLPGSVMGGVVPMGSMGGMAGVSMAAVSLPSGPQDVGEDAHKRRRLEHDAYGLHMA